MTGRCSKRELAHELGELAGVGARGEHPALGPLQLGRRDHLHGLGDLLGVLDRADPLVENFDPGTSHGLPFLLLLYLGPTGREFLDGRRQVLNRFVLELAALGDGMQHARMLVRHEGVEVDLPGVQIRHGHAVQVALRSGENDRYLLLDVHGHVLVLLEDLDHALAAGELLLGGLVQVAAELGEGRQLAVLGEVQAQGARHLFHGFGLGGATHPRNRDRSARP